MNINKVFTHLSIRTKLIVAFLGIGLVPVLVLGGVNLIISTKALQRTAIAQVHALLTAKAERIQDALRHAEKDLRLLSQSPSLTTFVEFYPDNIMGKNNLNRMLYHTLKDFAAGNPLYSEILLLNEKGGQILSVRRHGEDILMEGPDDSINMGRKNFFWKVFDTRQGEVVITSSMEEGRPEGPTEAQSLVYSTGLYDRGHRIKGVLAFHLPVKDLAALAKSREPPLGNTYLLDRSKSFLHHIEADEKEPVTGGFPGALTEETLERILSGREGLITNEKNRLISYTPILPGIDGPENYWVLLIDVSRSVVLAPVRRFLFLFFLMVILLSIIGTFLGVTASHQFTRPILKLHRGAQLLAKGDFDHPIEVNSNDEIEDLAHQFNHMADRLRASQEHLKRWNEELRKEVDRRTEQLIQAEKMAALGGLSAGIAHEIGNPLAGMKANIQLLVEQLGSDPSHHRFLERILKEINRLNHFLQTFSSFAKPSKPQPAPCDIRKVIRDVTLFIHPEAAKQRILIEEELDTPLPNVWVDPNRMQQVFLNLFLNSIQAMPQGGRISIEANTERTETDGPEADTEVLITVSDTGPGIPKEDFPKIFEPFFTTKPKGTGLGLSIAHQIVSDNGGSISVAPNGSMGTTFLIRLKTDLKAVPVVEGR